MFSFLLALTGVTLCSASKSMYICSIASLLGCNYLLCSFLGLLTVFFVCFYFPFACHFFNHFFCLLIAAFTSSSHHVVSFLIFSRPLITLHILFAASRMFPFISAQISFTVSSLTYLFSITFLSNSYLVFSSAIFHNFILSSHFIGMI